MPTRLPRWVNFGLLPLINLAMAFLVAGLIGAALSLDDALDRPLGGGLPA